MIEKEEKTALDEAKENNSKYNKYLGLNKSAQTAQINNDQEISQSKVEKYTTEELREKCFKSIRKKNT